MMSAASNARHGSIRRSVRASLAALALAVTACTSVPSDQTGPTGKPIGEFLDDLKTELRDVHWRVRSNTAACGSTDAREVDLRNATITVDLQRIGEATIDGAVRLVAVPLAGGVVAPFASVGASRRWTQEIVLKLDVAGASQLHDLNEHAVASGAVARSLNAAIDGFMRSSNAEPCIRLTALKLTFVIDVRRDAGGGFKLVVPVADLGVEATRRDVNTLTLSWDKVVSNALR